MMQKIKPNDVKESKLEYVMRNLRNAYDAGMLGALGMLIGFSVVGYSMYRLETLDTPSNIQLVEKLRSDLENRLTLDTTYLKQQTINNQPLEYSRLVRPYDIKKIPELAVIYQSPEYLQHKTQEGISFLIFVGGCGIMLGSTKLLDGPKKRKKNS